MKYNKLNITDQTEITDIGLLHIRLANMALLSLSILSVPPLISYLVEIKNEEWNFMPYTYITAVVILYTLLFIRKRISFKIKSWTIIIILLIVGTLLVERNGIYGAALIFFMMAIVLATLFFGIKNGTIILILSILSLVIIGLLVFNGLMDVKEDIVLYNKNPMSWVSDILVLLLFGGATILIAGITYYLLNRNITILNNRNKELEKAKNEAQMAYRAKNEFLTNISHEIRTPINSIIAIADLLSNILNETKNKLHVKSIKTSSLSLLKLIDQILDLSAIETDKFGAYFEMINTSVFFQNLIEIYKPMARVKNLDFIYIIIQPFPDCFYSDKTRMNIILSNLLDNAVKFTEKGYIKLTLEANKIDSTGNSSIIITIEDTGKGISGDFLNKPYENFLQEDGQSTRKYDGIGLGLSLSDKLVRKLDGTIQLESKVDKGTIISICFNKIKSKYYNNKNEETENQELLSFQDQPGEYKFSHEEKENLSIVIKVLINDIYKKWEKLKDDQSVNEIKRFANEIISLGKKYKITYIQSYGELFINALDDFAIDEVQKLLQVYPQIIAYCKGALMKT